jgi:dTDP-4-dehydrorhamnose reductase
MRILITGAGGQLGRSLIQVLDHHEVIALRHGELDITDERAVRDVVRSTAPDVVINAAAYNDVDGAESHVSQAEAINAYGPRILATASAAASIPIVHVSTDYVFDGRADRPYHEDDSPNPLSAYGRSKRAGELAVMDANPRHFVVRTAWLFDAQGKNFLAAMRARSNNPQVRVAADQFGSPTYAPHLARSIARLVEGEAFGLYHIAGSGGASRYDLVRHLYDLLGVAIQVVPVKLADFPAAAVRPSYTVLASIKDPALSLPPWREGVRAYVAELGLAR